MSIIFEEVTGEVAPRSSERSADAPATGAAPASQSGMREQLLRELAMLRERQARLFVD